MCWKQHSEIFGDRISPPEIDLEKIEVVLDERFRRGGNGECSLSGMSVCESVFFVAAVDKSLA